MIQINLIAKERRVNLRVFTNDEHGKRHFNRTLIILTFKAKF